MHGVETPAPPPANAPQGVNPTFAAIEQVVRDNAIGLSGQNLSVEVVWSAGGAPGSEVRVTAQYPFVMVAGPLLGNVGQPMTISRSASAPIIN